jgi:hypothetical protein
MLDKLKKLFAKKPEAEKVEEPKKPKVQKPKAKELSEKEKATANNEPYIAITKVELDPNNINDGSFDLDWNDKFVLNLIRAGYKIKPDETDEAIVDRWFQTICRNIALEMYEQQQADPDRRDVRYQVQMRKLDNGRTEIS